MEITRVQRNRTIQSAVYQWCVFQPEYLGGIYRRNMAIGKIPTVDFAAGGINVFWKNCWKIYPQMKTNVLIYY